MKRNILHLNLADQDGGAARAAYRIHAGLCRLGVDSRMLVGTKTSDDPTVSQLGTGFAQRCFSLAKPSIEMLPIRFWYRPACLPYFFANWLPDGVAGHEAIANADLIQLHWVSAGILRPETLTTFKKPIVWCLLDQWAFTGGCHYSGTCTRYESQCGSCPQLESISRHDLSHRAWKRKMASYSQINLTIVSPSNWLAELARRSSLLGRFPVRVIPSGVDTDIFRPIDRFTARALLRLPQDRPLIAFGGIRAVDDPRKGFKELLTALNILAANSALALYNGTATSNSCPELLVFGASRAPTSVQLPLPTHFFGTIRDDLLLALAYSAADVFVAPSLEENFANTVLEALSCGTPVAAFRLGGMPDLIHHQENGWLATPVDPADLARGIFWTIETNERRQRLAKTARSSAVDRFSLEQICRMYRDLYSEILDSARKMPG